MSELAVRPLLKDYVSELKEKGYIRSPVVEQAFLQVERHHLLEVFYHWPQGWHSMRERGEPQRFELDQKDPDPEALKLIYADNALATRLQEGRATSSTSQPAVVAAMLEALDLKPGMKALEIGTGTGYNAALMAEMVGDPALITTIDVQADVVAQTKRLLKRAGYGRICVLCRDGAEGAPEHAPFDRIVATVGCPDISWRWVEQLALDGFLLIPLQHGGLNCDPLVKLSKSDICLAGPVVSWSGFMLIQGELAPASLWGPIDYYESDFKDRPPDREYPKFPELDKGKLNRGDFHYFLALCDRRAYMSISAVGLAEPDGMKLIALDSKAIRLWGDETLYRDFEGAYLRWVELGQPKLTDWHVTLCPKGQAFDLPADNKPIWIIDRIASRQLVRRA